MKEASITMLENVCKQLPAGYEVHERTPSVTDYLRLRQVGGLTPRSHAAAEAGLPNSLYVLCIEWDDQVIGMGRVVGDGALFLHIVDVVVDPSHQGRGLGRLIVSALMAFVENSIPAEAYVSLMANGEAHRLYQEFDFLPVLPDARGMAKWVSKRTP